MEKYEEKWEPLLVKKEQANDAEALGVVEEEEAENEGGVGGGGQEGGGRKGGGREGGE